MHVLLGIGGRDDSFTALEKTVERVAETGDSLTIAILDNPDAAVDRATIRDRIDSTLDATGIEAEVVEIAGDPGGGLVDLAEQGGFDRVVVGGGKRSPMGKITVGSIGEFVVLNADTTVTLIR